MLAVLQLVFTKVKHGFRVWSESKFLLLCRNGLLLEAVAFLSVEKVTLMFIEVTDHG